MDQLERRDLPVTVLTQPSLVVIPVTGHRQPVLKDRPILHRPDSPRLVTRSISGTLTWWTVFAPATSDFSVDSALSRPVIISGSESPSLRPNFMSAVINSANRAQSRASRARQYRALAWDNS